ncbi:MAG: glycosyl hydrolase family 8 [Propionicimonas sp.]
MTIGKAIRAWIAIDTALLIAAIGCSVGTTPSVSSSSTPRPSASAATRRPFGQHTGYTAGTIRPSVPQDAMDATVAELYDAWKDAYLTRNPYQPDQYYVFYNREGYTEPEDAVTTSESTGYGMLITAIMAGHDPQAQTLFDGLSRFAKAHPSSINPDLMAWQQRDTGTAIVSTTNDDGGGDDAATDGDLDMAYALLLADQQWGSGGEIDYLAEARRVMDAILTSEVDPTHHTLRLGDWASDDDSYATATRPSDFMTQHLKEFATSSGEPRWTKVVDQTYRIEESLFRDHSPRTGLLPDFVELDGSTYRPASPDFLEANTDGDYSWNSARTPWRIGTDYLMTGDPRPKAQLAAMNAWIRSATGGDPEKIAQGYTLAGEPIDPDTELTFSAPFAVSAMIDAANREWLDALWATVTQEPVTSYFGDSIRLLSLIVVSGNWWSPTGIAAG